MNLFKDYHKNIQSSECKLSCILCGRAKKELIVSGSTEIIIYNPEKRIGIGLSVLGTSSVVNLGANAFALNEHGIRLKKRVANMMCV